MGTQTTDETGSGSLACNFDTFSCPNGTSVERDPENDCEFYSCDDISGSSNNIGIGGNLRSSCNDDTITCQNGTTIGRNPDDDCNFFTCVTCDDEVKLCQNGYTNVSRNPDNDCSFDPCPEPFRPTCANVRDECL